MSEHSSEHLRKQVKTYVRVFAALAVLTVLTVAASYLHLPILIGIGVALAIATLKGSLVAGFFMHLAGEKRIILVILLLTLFFFLTLLILPAASRP